MELGEGSQPISGRVGTATPQELGELRRMFHRLTLEHQERERQLQAVLAESQTMGQEQQAFLRAVTIHISHPAAAVAMSAAIPSAAPQPPPPPSLSSILQSSQGFFARARAAEHLYPTTVQEWEAAATPLLDSQRGPSNKSAMLKLCFAVAALRRPNDLASISLCYMMMSKVGEAASSAYVEIADRLLTSEDLDSFRGSMEVERAPSRQPFRVTGWQRFTTPAQSAEPAPEPERAPRGTKAAASSVKRKPRVVSAAVEADGDIDDLELLASATHRRQPDASQAAAPSPPPGLMQVHASFLPP